MRGIEASPSALRTSEKKDSEGVGRAKSIQPSKFIDTKKVPHGVQSAVL
jgi:hypothetical protein